MGKQSDKNWKTKWTGSEKKLKRKGKEREYKGRIQGIKERVNRGGKKGDERKKSGIQSHDVYIPEGEKEPERFENGQIPF